MYSLCVKGVMQQERVLSVATLSVSSFIVSVHESLHAGTVDRGLSSVI